MKLRLSLASDMLRAGSGSMWSMPIPQSLTLMVSFEELPAVIRANFTAIGATNYKGNILFAAEGQGDNKPAELIILNPREPYNTTGALGCQIRCKLEHD